MTLGGARLPVRAAVGSALIVGFSGALARIRRSILREPPEPSRRLARMIGPLSLATGTLLIFLPMGAYWPGDVPDLAEASVVVIIGGLLFGYACRVQITGARWLWRRLHPAAGTAGATGAAGATGRPRLRPAAGRPAP